MVSIDLPLFVVVVVGIALVVTAGFAVYALIELRKAAIRSGEFMKSAEESINIAMRELADTARSIRKLSDDVNSVTGDLSAFSSSIAGVAEDIRDVGDNIERFTEKAAGRVSGIKVGLVTAYRVLASSLRSK